MMVVAWSAGTGDKSSRGSTLLCFSSSESESPAFHDCILPEPWPMLPLPFGSACSWARFAAAAFGYEREALLRSSCTLGLASGPDVERHDEGATDRLGGMRPGTAFGSPELPSSAAGISDSAEYWEKRRNSSRHSSLSRTPRVAASTSSWSRIGSNSAESFRACRSQLRRDFHT